MTKANRCVRIELRLVAGDVDHGTYWMGRTLTSKNTSKVSSAQCVAIGDAPTSNSTLISGELFIKGDSTIRELLASRRTVVECKPSCAEQPMVLCSVATILSGHRWD